jgi:hypothetical protein
MAGLVLLAGCGAGKNAQTAEEVPAIPGVDVDAGQVALRDLLIPYRADGYPAGSDVPLVVRVFSNAAESVALNSVTPGTGGPLSVRATRIGLVRATSQAPSATRSPTKTGAASPTPLLVLQPNGYQLLVPPSNPHLVAEKISARLFYGEEVPVRFTFSTGDVIEADVPMAPPSYPVTPPSR